MIYSLKILIKKKKCDSGAIKYLNRSTPIKDTIVSVIVKKLLYVLLFFFLKLQVKLESSPKES